MHQQPKIVHLTSVHTAFDVRVFHKECKSLARSGKHVVLIVPHPRDEVVDSVEVKGIRISGGRLVRMTRTAWSLYREALRQNGDVYHFHDPELIPVGLLLAAHGKTVVYDIHEDAPADMLYKDYIPGRLRRPLMWSVRKLENAACRRFSGLIAATPTIAERFCPINANTVVVHNYPMLDEIAPNVALPWNERSPIMAYIGSISERRGIREIVQALALLPPGSPAQLMLAGPFSPEGLRTELERPPGWARVQYQGVLDRPSVANLLSRVRLGLLVDPQDPQAVARAMEYLLSHDAEAEAMGRRGRQAACELYNWNSEERVLLKFYSQLLETQVPEKRKEDKKASPSATDLGRRLNVSTR